MNQTYAEWNWDRLVQTDAFRRARMVSGVRMPRNGPGTAVTALNRLSLVTNDDRARTLDRRRIYHSGVVGRWVLVDQVLELFNNRFRPVYRYMNRPADPVAEYLKRLDVTDTVRR